jgi:predicted XRE-type DNA-binding protein
MPVNRPFKTTGKGDEVTLISQATTDYVWDDYDSIVKIQWSIKVRAANELHARRQIAEIVEHILDQTNYTQEIADESIEIDIYK